MSDRFKKSVNEISLDVQLEQERTSMFACELKIGDLTTRMSLDDLVDLQYLVERAVNAKDHRDKWWERFQ